MPHGDALLRQIGFEKKEMPRAPGLKFELTGVRPGCRPQNFTLDSKLSQDLARLSEVTLHLWPGSSNLAFIIRVFAVGPGFRKAPGRIVQQQPAEGKQPQEKAPKQSHAQIPIARQTPESSP